jgi:hypothetical protein
MRVADLLCIEAHDLLHRQGGIAGPHRMIFMRQRGAEQRHDAVAHDLIHGALVLMNRGHHPLKHRVEELARLLGIAIGQQLHGAFQIGKQDRDLFAFTFEGGLGGEDFLGQIPRGVLQR